MKVAICISIILIVTAIAFLPSLRNGFVNWDDDLYILENLRIRSLSWGGVKEIFTSFQDDLYAPLTLLSFAVEYRFFGPDPSIYHLTNLIFHLANSLLVFWLVLLLSRRLEIALIAALLFGVHPLQVESVAWITERKDVLYAFFFLLSLVSYLCYLRKKSGKYYYFSLILFSISLLPKAQGVTLPFTLLIVDYFHRRRFDRRTLYEKVPFLLVATLFVIVALAGQSQAGRLGRENLFIFSGLPNLLIGAYNSVFYLGKLALPVKLSAFYPYPAGPSLFFLFSPLISATLVIGAVYSGRYTRKVIFAGLFFLLNILPVLQVLPTGPAIAADRYLYIPSIAVFYLAGEWISRLRRKGYLAPAATAIIVILLVLLTRQRCRVWEKSETLWNDVLRKYPNAHVAHNNLANVFVTQNKLEEAAAHYRQALSIKPDHANSYNNLGLVSARRNNLEEAVSYYTEALRIEPDYVQAHNNLANALARQGRFEEALVHYSEALRLKPDSPDVSRNREIVREEMERRD